MGKNTDTIANCPAHIAGPLAEARARWAIAGIPDHRPHQAAEVLGFASRLFSSRSWDETQSLSHAQLAAWLSERAHYEEVERIAADRAATHATADLGTLTADEIALILAARKGGQ